MGRNDPSTEALLENLTDELAEDNDSTGMDIGVNPPLPTYRQVFLVVSNRAL